MTASLSPAGVFILLAVAGYILVRVFILSRPMHERSFKEIFEDMLLELIGAAIIVIGVLILPLFF